MLARILLRARHTTTCEEWMKMELRCPGAGCQDASAGEPLARGRPDPEVLLEDAAALAAAACRTPVGLAAAAGAAFAWHLTGPMSPGERAFAEGCAQHAAQCTTPAGLAQHWQEGGLFCACAPVLADDSTPCGCVGVLDRRRRRLTSRQQEALQRVARTFAALLAAAGGAAHPAAEETANESNARALRAILDAEPECVKLVSPEGILLEINPAGLAILEAERLDQVLGRRVLDLVAPEHRERFEQMHHAVCSGRQATLRFQSLGVKGGRRWLETRAVPLVLEPGGRPLQLAITRDITEQIRAEEEARARTAQLEEARACAEQQAAQLAQAIAYFEGASHRFTELFEGLPVPCFAFDSEGRIREWNRAATALYGYGPGEVFERPIWEVISRRREFARMRVLVKRVFAGEAVAGLEASDRRADGRIIQVAASMFPLRTREGKVSGGICARIDVTERNRLQVQVAEQLKLATELNARLEQHRRELIAANDRLAELATTDGLTGLKNHRHFRDSLEAGWSLSIREGLPLSVALLDVDRFKQYNDQFGHPAGDEVLRQLAGILKAQVRRHDLVARYGGEEFVILLPGAASAQSRRVLERVRRAVEAHPWSLRQVTVSIGAATLSPAVATPSGLVDLADQAL